MEVEASCAGVSVLGGGSQQGRSSPLVGEGIPEMKRDVAFWAVENVGLCQQDARGKVQSCQLQPWQRPRMSDIN